MIALGVHEICELHVGNFVSGATGDAPLMQDLIDDLVECSGWRPGRLLGATPS